MPGVSNMMFDCGGIEYTAAPFNGWYMGTEVGSRDFCDESRYNVMQVCKTFKVINKSLSNNMHHCNDADLWHVGYLIRFDFKMFRTLIRTNKIVYRKWQS